MNLIQAINIEDLLLACIPGFYCWFRKSTGPMFVKIQSEIPTLICTLRQRLGLSQEKLAAQLGVSFQTVNRWERGHAKPSQLALYAIQQRLLEMGDNGADLLGHYFDDPSSKLFH